MTVHVLIRGDLPNGAFEHRHGSQPVTCRMGLPADQVPATLGTHPPRVELRTKGSEQEGVPWRCKSALQGETPGVIGQKSA